jgi:hypothetical protein
MARYGQKFKERVVARLLPPESSPVEAVLQTSHLQNPTDDVIFLANS